MSHGALVGGDGWPDDIRLSDVEPLFTPCLKGADARGDLSWKEVARRAV